MKYRPGFQALQVDKAGAVYLPRYYIDCKTVFVAASAPVVCWF